MPTLPQSSEPLALPPAHAFLRSTRKTQDIKKSQDMRMAAFEVWRDALSKTGLAGLLDCFELDCGVAPAERTKYRNEVWTVPMSGLATLFVFSSWEELAIMMGEMATQNIEWGKNPDVFAGCEWMTRAEKKPLDIHNKTVIAREANWVAQFQHDLWARRQVHLEQGRAPAGLWDVLRVRLEASGLSGQGGIDQRVETLFEVVGHFLDGGVDDGRSADFFCKLIEQYAHEKVTEDGIETTALIKAARPVFERHPGFSTRFFEAAETLVNKKNIRNPFTDINMGEQLQILASKVRLACHIPPSLNPQIRSASRI
jgi:hypothetical protein